MSVDVQAFVNRNLERLRANPYPGRGIVQGTSPDSNYLAQVYWIMGRSENSRNRIFVLEENGSVRTKAYDESKGGDPSLVIYYPARSLDRCHIISNGDQTETISTALQKGKDLEYALQLREFEPDAPHFTPRISGIIDMMENRVLYRLAILKSESNDSNLGCLRQHFLYEKAIPGLGHGITTYAGDGDPLPSFTGEPWMLPIAETAQATLDLYWSNLHAENKVAILVKWINRLTFESHTIIHNKLT